MKKLLLYLIVGVVAYAGFMVVKLPAAVAYGLVQQELQPLSLSGIDGTVWTGRALRTSYQRRALGESEWSVHPLSLLIGNLSADVQVTSSAGSIDATVTGGFGDSALIEDMAGTLEVAALAPTLRLQGFRPEGKLRVELQQVEFHNKKPVAAAGEIVWSDARIQSPRALPLGGVVATISTTPQGIQAILRDRQSPFALNAVVTLQKNGTYRLSGKLSARGNAAPEVHQLMEALGVKKQGGALPLNFSGRL